MRGSTILMSTRCRGRAIRNAMGRNEALAARQHTPVFRHDLGKQGDRLLDGLRRAIPECHRFHAGPTSTVRRERRQDCLYANDLLARVNRPRTVGAQGRRLIRSGAARSWPFRGTPWSDISLENSSTASSMLAIGAADDIIITVNASKTKPIKTEWDRQKTNEDTRCGRDRLDPTPKEQPPRKLSGRRTARGRYDSGKWRPARPPTG